MLADYRRMLMALAVAAGLSLLIAQQNWALGMSHLLFVAIVVVVFYAAPLLPGTPFIIFATFAAFFYYVNVDRVNGVYLVCAGVAAIAAKELKWV